MPRWTARRDVRCTTRSTTTARADGPSLRSPPSSASAGPRSTATSTRTQRQPTLSRRAIPLCCTSCLRDEGYPVRDEDVVRLSAYTRRHLNVHGHYSFQLPDLAGTRRALRDPDTSDDEER